MDLTTLPKDFMVTSIQYTKHVHSDQYPSIDPSRQELNLAGKVVVITGASRGLGAKAFAPAFAKAGVKALILLATNGDKLKTVEQQIKEINTNIETLTLTADISDPPSVSTAFKQIKARFGHADILINNAGINADGNGIHICDADPDTWWRQFEVNAKGTFLVTQAFIRLLPTPKTHATLINLTSAAAWAGSPMMAGYNMSKLVAQQQISAIAALYPNITAVVLHPGLLETDMLPAAMRHFNSETPELPGGVAVWLSHPHARFLSGRVVAAVWDVDDLVARKDEIVAGRGCGLGCR
ncbi:Uu.00g041740.m01.CDS01 [Anthostomella pinea]|uniref:Uu.00g041740.m01.CDS01 n=1 Tax=Anthostomella pinea TaxID=933095 RepID=A0AAI8VAG5_9PEZI|nr:Uu.00g041740.m01.CDS01 [Anthostomella pinea]